MDSPLRQSVYLSEGFCGFPCPSEAILELKGYSKLSDYLNGHRSTKKHISPKNNISISLERDEVRPDDIEGMRACIRDSTRYARSKMPYGEMFMQRLLESDMFRSKDYLHVIVRVDGKIAGFHSFINCGSSLGAIVGGFNREVSQKNYVYERLIAATVDFAIKNRIERIHFGIVDNQTKLRLTNQLEPNFVYYFISSPVERWMMRMTNKYTDVYKLFLLEESLKNNRIENYSR